MYIECFLHSNATTGEYIGFEGLGDIYKFSGCDLQLINSDFNNEIKDSFIPDVWENVKDSVFRIEFDIEDGEAIVCSIEKIDLIYRI